jgi:hypothetical protein
MMMRIHVRLLEARFAMLVPSRRSGVVVVAG